MGKPTAQQTWAGVAMAVLALLSSYLGYDKYERYQESKAEAGNQSVEVNIASVPDSLASHMHGPVLSRTDIKLMIRDEIEAYDTQVKETYKRLEAWEKQ